MWDFLERFFPKYVRTKRDGPDTTIIEVPPDLYYKEMALYTAISLLANAISKCNIKVYEDNKEIKNEDWYTLNVSPNKNESSSLFWHKVIEKMIRGKEGALVIETEGNELHCANSFSIIMERPILGNIYGNINLNGNLNLNRTYRAEEVYLFKLENEPVKKFIDGLYEDYGKLLQSAVRAFKDTNGRKFKLKLEEIKAGDEEFNEEYEEYISKQIQAHLRNEYSTYIEYEGYELVEEKSKNAKSADDVIKLRKDMFDVVGQAFKIPQALMAGNVTSLKDVCDVFLTFSVDPVADMMGETLNKRAGKKEVLNGNYYKVDTGSIKHRDIFDLAPNIDKLISSGYANIDEVREETGYIPKGEWWSIMHWITKNYAKIEDVANGTVEGGEKNE